MTYQGTVKGGVVVLEADVPPPEGTRVTVEVATAAEPSGEPQSLGELLLRFAGCFDDLPADFATEQDHYVHGTPKRSES